MLVAAFALASLFSACADEERNDVILRDALRRTERLARRYTYTDESAGTLVTVQGVVDDDFRHAERLLIDDQPALDQVVKDDSIAVRFLATNLVPRFIGPRGGTIDVPDGPKAVPVPDVLATRRWVVDQSGAPAVLGRRVRADGADPVFDALTTLKYVEESIGFAQFVRIFNPEALDYKPAEDPFPHPKDGQKRYDLQRPPLPRAADGAGGGGANQAVPGLHHFRRMAVYVEDGLVREVREVIDVETRLRELARVYGVDFPDRPPSELAGIAVDSINAVRVAQGNDPIRVRAMVLRLADLGDRQTVDLPPDALAGTLDLRAKDRDEEDRRGGADAGSDGGSGGSGSGGSGGSTSTTTSTTTGA